jgi:hypothetical protein
VDDVTVLCANCHRMIHRRRPALSLAELQVRLKEVLPSVRPLCLIRVPGLGIFTTNAEIAVAVTLAYYAETSIVRNRILARHQEVSREVPPRGVEQEERPDEEHDARDQTEGQRTYARPRTLEPAHDPLVVAGQRENEQQDQRGMANEGPRPMSGYDGPEVLRSSGDHHQRDEGGV